MSVVECPNCHSAVPAESRYCPECGRPLLAGEEETPSAFPLDPFLLVVALVAVGGVILLIGGEWAWGVAVLLFAGILFFARRELEHRRTTHALGALRARAAAAGEAVAARSREQVELFRARRELAELDAQRSRAFHELGRAVFHEDEEAIEAARSTVTTIVDRMRAKEAEVESLREETERRVERAQLQARPTARMDTDAAEAPAEPAPTPEEPPPKPKRRSK